MSGAVEERIVSMLFGVMGGIGEEGGIQGVEPVPWVARNTLRDALDECVERNDSTRIGRSRRVKIEVVMLPHDR